MGRRDVPYIKWTSDKNMPRIKFEEVKYIRYQRIALLDVDANNAGVNLKQLYLYIGRHKNYGRNEMGNAYMAIREEANRKYSRRYNRFSKREVSSLIRIFNNPSISKSNRFYYVKIPYRQAYLFRIIFQLVEEMKGQYDLPVDLKEQVGKIKRDVFYREQSQQYEIWYKENEENQSALNRYLFDDLFSAGCPLSSKF
ncbi:MAG: hypothetical protein LUI87_03465 [Lachnospiraceae bacterium]|nr:hypothetical protein [Lachnospiraceae bacterium]